MLTDHLEYPDNPWIFNKYKMRTRSKNNLGTVVKCGSGDSRVDVPVNVARKIVVSW